MELFWKASAAVLLTVVLVLALQKREISLLLVLAVCCMTAAAAMSYLEPVVDLLRELEDMMQMDQGMLSTLMKAAGIGLVAEIGSLICSDGGSGSLGKTLQILGAAGILFLSVPLFQSLLNLIREILGHV